MRERPDGRDPYAGLTMSPADLHRGPPGARSVQRDLFRPATHDVSSLPVRWRPSCSRRRQPACSDAYMKLGPRRDA